MNKIKERDKLVSVTMPYRQFAMIGGLLAGKRKFLIKRLQKQAEALSRRPTDDNLIGLVRATREGIERVEDSLLRLDRAGVLPRTRERWFT